MPRTKKQRFISRKIRKLKKEHVPKKQRVAIALSMARKRGFKVKPKKSEGLWS